MFSDEFLPVAGELVGKILNGKFINMAELLCDNIEAERRRGQNEKMNTCSGMGPKQSWREIPDLFNVLESMTASQRPKRSEKMSKMLAYPTMLVREATQVN